MTTLHAKWRYCCYWTFFLIHFTANAQTNIRGTVVDENGDTPLPNASVFFNRTAMATYTNQQGDFYFTATKLLNTELVISCTGYEILVYKPIAEQVEGKRIIFKLRAKEKSPDNKTTLKELDKIRRLHIFYQNFLGVTEEAATSKIINETNIYFGPGETNTSFRAYADTPIVIINNMLGYKISFNLEEFWYDEVTGENYFFGYIRYDGLGNNKKFARNRQHCYYGSTLHFYRSLIAHQLYQQGFGTFLTQPAKNAGTTKNLRTGELIKSGEDSMMAIPVSAPEILFIDSTNNFSIQLTDKLLVQYNKDPFSKSFLLQNAFVEGNLSKGVESYIHFKDSLIGINNAGVLSDATSVAYSGYWIYERVANLLPYDYQPD